MFSQGLRTKADRAERQGMQAQATRQAIGVDDKQPLMPDEDRDEGEFKGMVQPKIAGQEGIEYDTGNS